MQRLDRALIGATGIGTAAQLVMVVAGHYEESVALMFGPLGTAISAAAGALYGLLNRGASWREALFAGAVAGGLCALVGIALSLALGDVTPFILIAGTLASAVAGAVGAAAVRFFRKPGAA